MPTPAFSVAASGSGLLLYHWRMDGVDLTDGGNISGAMTNTLTIDPVAGADAGSYDFAVSNACGSVTSVVNHKS